MCLTDNKIVKKMWDIFNINLSFFNYAIYFSRDVINLKLFFYNIYHWYENY